MLVAKDLMATLTHLGYSVVGSVRRGEEAVEWLESSSSPPPDLILMDIGLPGQLDGIETARAIGARGAVAEEIPVVGNDDQRPFKIFDRFLQNLFRNHIKVVRRLIHYQ